ncbi:hypothetical protein MNBD_ALPHA07-1108 [hydrothermal vent metagenome]|uniref:Uncharacterized protein n=1 Tax=hydrothermal vent metagenome TaxID=652676 RepID=A0A3B0SM32_9ZZZZ
MKSMNPRGLYFLLSVFFRVTLEAAIFNGRLRKARKAWFATLNFELVVVDIKGDQALKQIGKQGFYYLFAVVMPR